MAKQFRWVTYTAGALYIFALASLLHIRKVYTAQMPRAVEVASQRTEALIAPNNQTLFVTAQEKKLWDFNHRIFIATSFVAMMAFLWSTRFRDT